jgi:hypothetical protein
LRQFIPLPACKPGHTYRLVSRNLNIGVFVSNGFIGIREKFGHEFLSIEEGAAYEEIGLCPVENLSEHESPFHVCHACGVKVEWVPDGWRHAEPSTCQDAQPVRYMNRPLFDYLEAIARP